MNTYDLMLTIKEILSDSGYVVYSPKFRYTKPFVHFGYAYSNGAILETPIEHFEEFSYRDGIEISFHANVLPYGTYSPSTVVIAVNVVINSERNAVFEESVNVQMSKDQILNKITNITNVYDALVTGWKKMGKEEVNYGYSSMGNRRNRKSNDRSWLCRNLSRSI